MTLPTASRTRNKGSSLIEVMVASVLMAIGLLGNAALLATLTKATTQTGVRLVATQLATELQNTATADYMNLGCYATAGGGCGSPVAAAFLDSWKTRVSTALPGGYPPEVAVDSATGDCTITLQWKLPQDDTVRNYVLTTQVDQTS
jgi:type IV pilus assembly protein PilV